jgi:glycosyltransferase involved in cell wall biosynthesis
VTAERLTILSVAFPFAPVGPDAVGGAEQVLAMIDEGLVAAGHRSIVVACEGSRCAGELVAVPPARAPIDERGRSLQHACVARALQRAIARTRPDVVHMHGVDFHAYLPEPGPPVIATLHLPLSFYSDAALAPRRPGTWLVGVSAAQMRAAPLAMPRLPDVGNGVRLDELAPVAGPRRRYALVAGRICPEKGVHLAVAAARCARVPLLIAGRVFPYAAHRRYFDDAVAPHLGAGCRFVGAVGPARKRQLMGRARCVLVPSLVAETSSLVAMEALACGTPVVATRAGALPDVLEHGRTGLLVDGAEEMAAAVRDATAIDPIACREAAELRFSSRAMIARYVERYRRVAREGPCSS